MKRLLSTTAATVTLVFSLSTQAMSAVAQRHPQTPIFPITASNRQSSLQFKINSNNPEAHAQMRSGDEKGAIASIRFTFYSEEELHFNLGILSLLSGDMKGAIENFNQAIRMNPNYALAYKSRGFAKVQLGDEKEAIEDLQRAADIFQEQEETAEYLEVINIIKQINDK
ncbi:tetratricopeptide repeat protein [Nostoc parmelioides]|uniref:Tetratricopeptide repeat protein n=1 Tax=Nostoc parmelioides FACHB-3921 TaxID=2692909 RepID=A0ABR8B9T3_9NOSO|nr:tetratricopeptide repeat protein [Nostoc parmelioides]MBD2250591.1 tetratricopeptide repeat protein [Nostoc parmelioides FACHB-3921]